MSSPDDRGVESSTDRLPHKPTKEAAIGGATAEEALRQRNTPAGIQPPEHLGKDRQEVGSGAGSSRNPPHVPSQDSEAEIQQEVPSPTDVPVLPANASGVDKQTSGEQNEAIDEASMYDRRPERDKDRPPSDRAD